MSRKHRVEFEGAIYHVFQRGNNKEYIFKKDIEKGFFIKQIKEYMNAYNYEILAFTIMDNHYHIIIRTNKVPLSEIMHSINNVYSKFYNYHNKRTGHVFEERYSSKLVEDDAYLIWLLRYVHRNPVRAKICKRSDEYKWSSDNLYRRNRNIFVNIDFILNIIASKRSEAIRTYIKLVCEPDDEKEKEYKAIKEIYRNNILCYGENFRVRTEIKYKKSLDEIIAEMELVNEDIELIKSGSRKRYLTEIKLEFIKNAIENKYTYDEIGRFICVSQSGISRLLLDKGYDRFSNNSSINHKS